MTQPKGPITDLPEKWRADLRADFTEVWVYANGRWISAHQVADPITFEATVRLRASKYFAFAAMWETAEGWMLRTSRGTKVYPTREAAEMVAIHTGGRSAP